VDQLDIRPSEHWDRAVERAIAGARCVVVLLSPRSVASENVADEISLAIELRKPILPVMIEQCKLPLRLTRMHLIDASAAYGAALKQCLAEIRSMDSGSAAAALPFTGSPPVRDPEVLASAKTHLASVMGPIAGFMVDSAAARATSVEDLYTLLTRHIGNEKDRERFIAMMPRAGCAPEDSEPTDAPANAGPMQAFELERIAMIFTKFLGPIATIVVKEESKAFGTVGELVRRLADMLSSDEERERLIQEIGAELFESGMA